MKLLIVHCLIIAVMKPPVMLWIIPTIKVDEISINWLIQTDEDNSCAPFVLMVWCNYTKILGAGYQPLNGTSQYNVHKATENVMIKTTVGKLSPFTKYICGSDVINAGGRSKKSAPIQVDTSEDGKCPT